MAKRLLLLESRHSQACTVTRTHPPLCDCDQISREQRPVTLTSAAAAAAAAGVQLERQLQEEMRLKHTVELQLAQENQNSLLPRAHAH